MTKPTVIEEKPLTMVEMKTLLESIKKRDGELNFRANKTEEYLNHFVTLKEKDIIHLKEKLTSLNIPRLKEQHIVKIIDLLPKNADDAKVVFQSFPTLSVSQQNLKKIADTIAEVV